MFFDLKICIIFKVKCNVKFAKLKFEIFNGNMFFLNDEDF